MTHKERVIEALNHREPDRVPLDFGSTGTTGIAIPAYQELQAHLGVDAETIALTGCSNRPRWSRDSWKAFRWTPGESAAKERR